MMALQCERKGSRKEAIEFLMMAGKTEEAFIIAQTNDEMDTYAANLGDGPRAKEEWLKIAQ